MPTETPNTTAPIPTPEMPIPPTPKKGNMITIVVVAVFILLALGIIAFLYYQNQQLKGMLSNSQTPVSSPAPITVNLKTYTNTKFNFQFDYPNDWTTKEAKTDLWTNEIGDDLSVVSLWPITNKSPLTPATENEIGVQVIKVKPDTSLSTWVKARGDNGKIPSKYFTATQINGNNAIKKDIVLTQDLLNTLYNGPAGPAVIGTRNISVYIIWGDIIVSFTGISINNSQDFVASFDQILSTFKFLGASATPSASPVACTQEAKICPDGSSVGRTGPKCEFAACP